MKKMIIIWGICYIMNACSSPGTTTRTTSDTTVLNPNKTKVQTDTTMHKDTSRHIPTP
jgi:hypothetical protein